MSETPTQETTRLQLFVKSSQSSMASVKRKLLYEVALAASDYTLRHASRPHRIWLSREAGEILLSKLSEESMLFAVPVEVTTALKGLSFAMVNRGSPAAKCLAADR